MPNSKRFQMDAQWQKGFRELVRAREAMRRHTEACKGLHDSGKLDEARTELALADEAKERAELLEHSLRDL